MENNSQSLPRALDVAYERLAPSLMRSESDERPVALMVCGVAGSGKSTFSKAVSQRLPTFQRVSIDGIIASRHGIYGVDYPQSEYVKYQDEADTIFHELVERILADGINDIILDRSFYAKEDRDLFKALVEKQGGRWVLVFLNTPKEVLWQRICARRLASVNADSALEISQDLLNMFYEGFEVPISEGEIVIDTCFDIHED